MIPDALLSHFMDRMSYTDFRSTDHYAWKMAIKRYNRIRWLKHVARVYPPPHRKLRKCEMRKIQQRKRKEGKRYE
jgi:hypothetical protein